MLRNGRKRKRFNSNQKGESRSQDRGKDDPGSLPHHCPQRRYVVRGPLDAFAASLSRSSSSKALIDDETNNTSHKKNNRALSGRSSAQLF